MIRCAIEKKDMALIGGNNAVRMSLLVKLGEKFQDMIISDIENGTISFPVDEQDKEIVNSITQSLRPNIERAKELKDIIAKGERFIPKYYWPELTIASFWLSASIGITVPQLRALLPETTKFIDTGYGASELKINIPLSPEHTDGLLSTTTAFYEFVHIEDEMFERPLLANQIGRAHV